MPVVVCANLPYYITSPIIMAAGGPAHSLADGDGATAVRITAAGLPGMRNISAAIVVLRTPIEKPSVSVVASWRSLAAIAPLWA